MNLSITNWLKTRVPMEQFSFEHMQEKAVPRHKHGWIYYLGGLVLIAFVIQVVTGMLLLLAYKPTPAEAHRSIQYITRLVPGGLLVRNMHVWSSNAMILLMVLHAFTVFFARAYRKPRELSWVTGTLSLLVVLGLGFSGYLLPWNNLAVYATKVGTEIMSTSTAFLPGALSQIGVCGSRILMGGETVGAETLSRFFALHIVILPLVLLGLVSVHLLLIQLHGISVPLSVLKKNGDDDGTWRGAQERYVPFFLLKESGVWLLFIALMAILSLVLPYDLFVPYTLLAPYDPLASAPAGIRPEWYFWFMYYPFEMLPRTVVIVGTMLFFAGVIFAPLLMAGIPRLWKGRFEDSAFPTWVGVVVAVCIFVLTVFGQSIVMAVRGGGHA